MTPKLCVAILLFPQGLLIAQDAPTLKQREQNQADRAARWDKPVPEWSADDALEILKDSPWVKTVTPAVAQNSNDGPERRRPGGYGRGGGFGYPGGGGIGFPGGGIGYPGGGRRGGGGYPQGGNYPGNGPDDTDSRGRGNPAPTLTLRWESALPVREAELKTRDVNAPTLEEGYYAIAVYGVPSRMVGADEHRFADQLKGQAALKRDGKKDLKPSGVQLLDREGGPVIVYLFPRSKEITNQDRRVAFDAKIARLSFTQSFYVEDMVFQGKLEL
jgi:hypothetical protein